jgi:hypothetical protein
MQKYINIHKGEGGRVKKKSKRKEQKIEVTREFNPNATHTLDEILEQLLRSHIERLNFDNKRDSDYDKYISSQKG